MEEIEQEIQSLEKEIAKAERDLAKSEGVIESEKLRLETIGVSYEDLEDKLSVMGSQLKKISEEAQKELEEIKGGYQW